MDLNSQVKVRAAFTQTLQRPPLASSAGNLTTSYDTPVTRRIRYSNPYLLPVRSTNFDTSAEYYFGTQDAYISLGVFSRYLKDIPAVSSSESYVLSIDILTTGAMTAPVSSIVNSMMPLNSFSTLPGYFGTFC